MAVAHLTLARDVAASATFFTEALGWQPIAAQQCPASSRRLAAHRAGQELHLIEVVDFAPSPFEAEFGRHVAVAFPRGEFDGLKARLRALGAELTRPERPTPFARFFVRDPNGYVFEVVEAERRPENAR
jgi:catechol 2,3-dioxygenase-like lactoylglutathione lyase family enzyme